MGVYHVGSIKEHHTPGGGLDSPHHSRIRGCRRGVHRSVDFIGQNVVVFLVAYFGADGYFGVLYILEAFVYVRYRISEDQNSSDYQVRDSRGSS
jgi:hypothetical protein